ncbi:MAG: DivIVA domain-containing protein [Aerococcus sp.]|nr:DivIVA domain-containing protein [Aerococcus sp.]
MEGKDIQSKSFNKRFNGYDREEVDNYLKELARHFDQMEATNQYAQQELYAANQQLDEFRSKEASLNRSIVVAQQAADRLKSEALSEADLIVSRAKEAAAAILSDAADRATTVKRETEQLKDVARGYVFQMQGFINQAKDTLEDERWEKLYGEQPVDPVETPALDSVLQGLEFPVVDGEAAAIYDENYAKLDKDHRQEEFFEQKELYQVRLSKAPIVEAKETPKKVTEMDGSDKPKKHYAFGNRPAANPESTNMVPVAPKEEATQATEEETETTVSQTEETKAEEKVPQSKGTEEDAKQALAASTEAKADAKANATEDK